jgi:hypothetical protein
VVECTGATQYYGPVLENDSAFPSYRYSSREMPFELLSVTDRCRAWVMLMVARGVIALMVIKLVVGFLMSRLDEETHFWSLIYVA